jgi:hypothetical protein
MSDQVAAAPAPVTNVAPSAPANTNAPTPSAETAPSTKPDAASQERYEVKVNGKIHKLTRDELIQKASLGYSAHEKFEESAKQRKEIEKITSNIKKNPVEALMDPSLGLSEDQIRSAFEQWYHNKFILKEELSPEQRRQAERDAKLKRYEEEELKQNKAKEEEELNQVTAREREHLQKTIIDALEASKLPRTKAVVGRIAFYMRENRINGWDAPMEHIMELVKNERREEYKELGQVATVEELIDLLGPDLIKKIRQHDLQQLRSKREARGFSEPFPQSGSKPRERISMDEVSKRLRNWG